MWIERKNKKYYLDSKKKGLRVRYSAITLPDPALKKAISCFIKWITTQYFFPIRCNVIIKPCPYFISREEKRNRSYGDFYYYDNSINKTPFIWIASGKYYTSKNKQGNIENILFTIAHELTHYFQWYFYEYENRSDRSLEIEANKWARYLVGDFLVECERLMVSK